MSPDRQPTLKLSALLVTLAFAAPVGVSAAPSAAALPTNPAVTNGGASFSQSGAASMVVTNAPGTIIRWDSFSIGSDASVTFNQTGGANSAVLNRVGPGSAPSEIFGRLDSNGRVFLINPNGIVFGSSARIDLQGLVASTLNLSDNDFLAGRYLFSEGGGNITVQSGATLLTSARGPNGQIWLIAGGDVKTESGSNLHTAAGQTVLVAGSRVEVTDDTTGGMRFTVTTGAENTIQHLGTIAAERGAVAMFADSIVHAGATSVAPGLAAGSGAPGTVQLAAARDIRIEDGSLIDASGAGTTPGGSIGIDAGNKVVIARLANVGADGSAEGSAAGRIDIAGHEVLIEPGTNGFANVHAAAVNPADNGTVNVVRRAASSGTTGAYVPVSYTGGADHLPNVSFLADGSYVVVWMEMTPPPGTIWDVTYATIYARRFSPTGQPLTEPFQVSQYTGYQYQPAVTSLADGGFLVVWSYRDDRPAPGALGTFPMRLYAKRYDSAGQAMTADFRIDPDQATAQTTPAVTTLTGGGFLVSWTAGSGTRMRLYDAAGKAASAPFSPFDATALTTTQGTAMAGHFVPYADGGFAHVYMRSLKTYTYSTTLESWDQRQIFVQRYDRNGAPIGTETQLASTFAAPAPKIIPSSYPTTWLDGVTALPNGDIVLTQRMRTCGTCDYKVYYSVFDSAGRTKVLDRAVDESGFNLYARVTALANGGFTITWEHTNPTSDKDNDVFTQTYDANGLPVGAPTLVSLSGVGSVDQPRIAAGADGRYVTVWSDSQSSGLVIRSMLTVPNAVGPAPVVNVASGSVPSGSFATRPGAANGALGLIADNSPPSVPTPMPEPETVVEPMPIPVVESDPAPEPAPSPAPEGAPAPGSSVQPVMEPAVPSAPVVDKKPPRNTESALNTVRLVTPTGQENFVFPGAATHFGGSLSVTPVRGADGAVVSYKLATQPPAAPAEGDGERKTVRK